jgi:hypothetical protein
MKIDYDELKKWIEENWFYEEYDYEVVKKNELLDKIKELGTINKTV